MRSVRASRASPASERPRHRRFGAELGPALIGSLLALAIGPPTAALAGADQRLSDELTLSRWANTARIAPIRTRPDPASPAIGRLHWRTEDGFPEVYLLLRRHWDEQGRAWIELRIPMRPNGRVGWVRADALGVFHRTRSLLVVDRRRLRISLYRSGRPAWSAPVGIGSPGMPTPAGHFWIRERFALRSGSSPYAPFAFGLSAYSSLTDWPGGGVVGIHGDFGQPQLIPGRPSHGCIRLRHADDAWLGHRVGTGTPVRIR
jgi:L,D-transpeptidase catalytic domain